MQPVIKTSLPAMDEEEEEESVDILVVSVLGVEADG